MSALSEKKKTVVIIGANSSLGKHLCSIFIEKKWSVIATSRKKPKLKEASCFKINLEKESSIRKGVKNILKNIDQIDLVILANGVVYSGAFESFTTKEINRQIQLNFLGNLSVVQKLLPKMREQKSGTIVTVSSLCGLVTFPMLSLYHASKWALEGFCESLYYEMLPFGIRVKIIEPGGIKSEDGYSSIVFPKNSIPEYQELLDKVHNTEWFPSFTSVDIVANQIYKATTDSKNQLRYIIGEESIKFVTERQNGFIDESYLLKMKSRFNEGR